jgi:hypothetical protein
MADEIVHPLGFAAAAPIPAQLAIQKRAPRISIRGSNLNASRTCDKNIIMAPERILTPGAKEHCGQTAAVYKAIRSNSFRLRAARRKSHESGRC